MNWIFQERFRRTVLIVLAPEYKHAQTHTSARMRHTIYISHIAPPSTVVGLSSETTFHAGWCVRACMCGSVRVCMYKSAVFINTIFTFTLDFIVISPFYIGVWMSDEGGAVPWNFQHPFYYNVRPESDLRLLIFGALAFGGRHVPLTEAFLDQNVMWWRELSINWITRVLGWLRRIGVTQLIADIINKRWEILNFSSLNAYLIMNNSRKFCLYLRCDCSTVLGCHY